MIVLPAVLLLFGAVVLVVGRLGPRASRLVELGAMTAGLTVSILLGLSEGQGLTSAPVSGIGAGLWGIRFTNSPASWALQFALLTWVLATALQRPGGITNRERPGRAAWLLYTAIGALSVVVGNLLTVILVWTALGVGERTLAIARADSDAELAGLPLVSSADVLAAVVLIGAGGLASVGSAEPRASGVFLLALMAAGVVRVVAADKTGQSLDPSGSVAGTGWEAALVGSLPAFGALAWGVTEAGTAGWPISAAWIAGLTSLAAAIILAMGSSPVGRRRSWIVVWLGLAVMVSTSAASETAAVIGAAGVVMVLGGNLFRDGAFAAVSWVWAAAGAFFAAGVPFLAGGVVAGSLSGIGTPLMAISILTMGFAASRFWGERSVVQNEPGSRSGVLRAGVALALVVGTSMGVYLRLHGDAVAWVEAAIALLGSLVVAGALRALSPARLSRWERALRWPELAAADRASQTAGSAALRLVRVVRDVLEGDASLLWAFVIILVAFLMLRGSA